MERNSSLFSRSPKSKKIHPGKISYTSGNGNPEKFLMFQETETLKNFLYFRKSLSELEK